MLYDCTWYEVWKEAKFIKKKIERRLSGVGGKGSRELGVKLCKSVAQQSEYT